MLLLITLLTSVVLALVVSNLEHFENCFDSVSFSEVYNLEQRNIACKLANRAGLLAGEHSSKEYTKVYCEVMRSHGYTFGEVV